MRGLQQTWSVARCALVIATGCYGAAVSAQTLDAPSQMQAWLQQPSLSISGLTVQTQPLREAYAPVGHQMLWTDENGLNARGTAVLQVLASADQQGLNPARYGIESIRAVAAIAPADANVALQRRLSLDVLVSDGLKQYAADMQGGSVAHQWNAGEQRPTSSDAARVVLQVAQSGSIEAALAALSPSTAEYAALRGSLQRHREVEAQGGWPEFSVGAKIAPGASDTRMGTLRQILLVQGDLAQGASAGDVYDATTVEGVKRFQERHGIEADGVIGTATQDALATSATERVQQIAMSMERMRWMPRDLGNRYVLVNVPAYKLKAVSGNKQLAMDVIVGKPGSKTPLFSKEIQSVSINPTWTVPSKIAANEMLPKARRNPGYLTRAGFTVINRAGERVSPSAVDWSSAGRGEYTFRQNAGAGNALGKVKFIIPNSDSVYLHDTSQRGLFARSERSLSHGCVRLSDPKAMTHFLLADEGWAEEEVNKAYESQTSRTVSISPMPVHTVYWTAWVDEAGATHFSRDVYGMDKSLLIAMGGTNHPRGEGMKLAMNASRGS